MRQESAYDKHNDAANEDADCLLRAAFPFLEDDAPDIAEHDVERLQDAPGEGQKDGSRREEALSNRKPEELAVPQETGQRAEHEVVPPHRTLGIIAPGPVLRILVETVAQVGHGSAEGNEEGGRETLEYLGGRAPGQFLAEAEADGEAGAHEACEQGHGNTFSEVEVLDGNLLGLVIDLPGLHGSGGAEDSYSYEGHNHPDDNWPGEAVGVAGKEGFKKGSQAGAGAEGYALPEGDAQVAHRKAECESPYSPKGSEEDGEEAGLGIGGEHPDEGFTGGGGDQGPDKRENEPGESALDGPV